jgi:hypothetical protein
MEEEIFWVDIGSEQGLGLFSLQGKRKATRVTGHAPPLLGIIA